MRVFFGLAVEGAESTHIADWRDRTCACDGTAVAPGNFHITLAFIGDISTGALQQIADAADNYFTATDIEGGTLTLETTGYWHKPGIFWIGPSQWPEPLDRLSQKLGHLSSAASGKREKKRRFQPHVTLYRRCRTAPTAPLQAPHVSLTYRHCTLFESQRGKQGIRYHALERWPLRRH